jgi:glycosyltransferase involved in cell wall biosynthesis
VSYETPVARNSSPAKPVSRETPPSQTQPSQTPPTRIAFCVTDLDAGGAERALVQIVTRLDHRRWEPHVFCLDAGGVLVDELRAAGVDVVCLGARRSRDFFVVWPLARRLAALRPAILQTFLFHANIVGRLAGTAARVPVIVSGIRVAEKRSRPRLWLDRLTDRLVTRHVCVSRDVADFSAQVGRLPSAKMSVIPNGVDVERFANAAPVDLAPFGVPTGSRVVLFVGRLDPQKGPFELLHTAAQLVVDHADVHLLMVGDGPLASELRAWATARNLDGRIHFAGRQANIAGLMRAADVFVLPSRWEGLPNVVLEAMAAGTPVVATAVEGIRDLLGDGKWGRVVSVGPQMGGVGGGHRQLDAGVGSSGENGLADALRATLADREHSRAAAAEAQSIVKERFTWPIVAAAYERLYAELATRSSK